MGEIHVRGDHSMHKNHDHVLTIRSNIKRGCDGCGQVHYGGKANLGGRVVE